MSNDPCDVFAGFDKKYARLIKKAPKEARKAMATQKAYGDWAAKQYGISKRAAVLKMKAHVLQRGGGDEHEESICPICLNTPNTLLSVECTYCKQKYDFECIAQWFAQKETQGERLTCPHCRLVLNMSHKHAILQIRSDSRPVASTYRGMLTRFAMLSRHITDRKAAFVLALACQYEARLVEADLYYMANIHFALTNAYLHPNLVAQKKAGDNRVSDHMRFFDIDPVILFGIYRLYFYQAYIPVDMLDKDTQDAYALISNPYFYSTLSSLFKNQLIFDYSSRLGNSKTLDYFLQMKQAIIKAVEEDGYANIEGLILMPEELVEVVTIVHRDINNTFRR